MEPWELKASIGAILVAADKPVSLMAMAKGLGVTDLEVEDALQEIAADLEAGDQGVQIRHRTGAVRLEVKPPYIDAVGRVLKQWTPKELSTAAAWTLALIAYQQPITTSELNSQRGKDCSAAVQTLRNRKMIARDAELGPRRTKRWRTTPHFLEVFGLSCIEDFYKTGVKEKLLPSLFDEDEDADEDDKEESVDTGQDEDPTEASLP